MPEGVPRRKTGHERPQDPLHRCRKSNVRKSYVCDRRARSAGKGNGVMQRGMFAATCTWCATTHAVTASTTTQAPLRDLPTTSLVVVGLGLVGGSIARAAPGCFGGAKVVGIDRATLAAVALDQAVVDAFVDLEDKSAVNSALGAADLVVIALPAMATTSFLERHAAALRDVVATDTAASKRGVARCASKLGLLRFVGGHPMMPRTHGGLASADRKWLEGARWFLCADDDDGALVTDASAFARVRAFVTALGGVPIEMGAAEHDRDVALTSHVPHLLANVLAEAVLEAGALDAAGAALRDILHVAGAPYDVWGDTVETNQAAIVAALDDILERLHGLRDHLTERDRIRELFATGRALRERLHG
jgi:prephenate dehydrogenase